MKSSILYPWKRFWCEQDGAYSLEDDGFLVDPETHYSRYYQRGILTLEGMESSPLLALLGEPGDGKSSVLADYQSQRAAALAARGEVLLLHDLRTGSDPALFERSVFGRPEIVAWSRGTHILHFLLDSLDEGQLQYPYIANALVEHLRSFQAHLARLRLRIACRSGNWPEQLTSHLPPLFGLGGLPKYELLPLRRRDVEVACEVEKIDAQRFFDAVRGFDAQPLASRPITLRMLLKTFGRGADIPQSRAELYLQGIRELVAEPSESRRGAGYSGTVSAVERLAIAGRLAALSVLCQRRLIDLDAATNANQNRILSESEVVGGVEPVGHGTIAIRRAAVEEVLKSGLFSSGGVFAHQSFAELLAAKYLVDHFVPVPTLLHLLVIEGSVRPRLAPQVSEVAAWLAELKPEVFTQLIDIDPQALLRSDFAWATDEQRQRLASALLDGYRDGRLSDISATAGKLKLERLAHPNLGEQLARFIFDAAVDSITRRFAIEVAERCRVWRLQDDLATLALDPREQLAVRQQAVRSLSRFADLPTRKRVLPLAAGSDPSDEDEELKGYALAALWPEGISLKDLLPFISVPRQKNFFGSYRIFLQFTFAARMSLRDLPRALEWIAERGSGGMAGLRELVEELLLIAARNLDELLIRTSLGNALLALLRDDDNVFHRDEKKKEFQRRLAVSPHRHSLLQQLVMGMGPRSHQVWGLTWFEIAQHGDLEWVIDQAAATDSRNVALNWARLAHALYQPESSEDCNAILVAAERLPAIMAEAFHGMLGALELESEEATRQREFHQHSPRRRTPRETPPSRRRERTLEILQSAENLDPSRVLRLVGRLVMEEAPATFSLDLATTPVWQDLPQGLRLVLLNVARSFLLTVAPSPDWFDGNQFTESALIAYRAVRLLFGQDRDWLVHQSNDFWTRWAAFVARFPYSTEPEDEPQSGLDLASLTYRAGPDAFLSGVRERIESENGQALSVLGTLRHCWDDRVCAELLTCARRGGLAPESLRHLIGELLDHGCPGALSYAEDLVSLPADEESRPAIAAAAVALLTGAVPSGWLTAWRAIDRDRRLGRQVIEDWSHFQYEGAVARVGRTWNEDHVERLILWLYREFPPEEDPEHSGRVTGRHSVGDLRYKLVRFLVERATPAACASLSRIESARPQDLFLRRLRIEAERNLAENTWIPLTPQDLFRLAQNPASPLILTSGQLLDEIVASITRFEQELREGAVPQLWDERAGGVWRPKDEGTLADAIKRHLQKDLGSHRLIALREVEVRRGIVSARGRQAGKRTDVLITGIVPEPISGAPQRLQVIVEVKGTWFSKLREKMKTQLADRYLQNTGCRHGLFLVGWYHSDMWDPSDKRRSAYRLRTRQALQEMLDADARQLSEGRTLRALVLDARLTDEPLQAVDTNRETGQRRKKREARQAGPKVR